MANPQRAWRLGATFSTFAAMALVLALAGCGTSTGTPQVAGVTFTPPPPSATPGATPQASPSEAPSPIATPGALESVTEVFPRELFAAPASANVTHRFFPLVPGARLTFEGEVGLDPRYDHTVIFNVTDLVKEIDGVLTTVIYDEDFTDGSLVEAEIAFFAQASDGTVWHLGEYPEEYEDGEFVDAPTWIAGQRDAKAGIQMQAVPSHGRSYSEGWGPEVGWTDRGRVFELDSRTCVPAACYDGVVVIAEYNIDAPDSHQLKYYAPGLGPVRVGWAGALEPDHEELALVKVEYLTGEALEAMRDKALALEAHGYEISPFVFGTTPQAYIRP
jgi:hypothetical protein